MSKNNYKQQLTLLVFTKDSIERVGPLIQTTGWIEHRIAIDMRSEDGTAEKLQEAGFEVYSIEREPFVDELRNRHLSLPKTPWTLILDSDEYLSEDAQEQLVELLANAGDRVAGFRIPRHNYFLDKKLMGSGWYPDHQLRLFRTNDIVYAAGHHKSPMLKDLAMTIEDLRAPSCIHIHHNNYPTIEEFLRRQLHYALTDEYDVVPGSFDFDDYMLRAVNQFNLRYESRMDGELSYVTGLVMYWDQILRGLIHWERTGYKGNLVEHIPNQAYVAGDFAGMDYAIARRRHELFTPERYGLEEIHAQYRNSLSWKITAPLRAAYNLTNSLFRVRK